MGTNTPYLNLYKPDLIGENVRIADLNNNSDKLDGSLNDINSRVTTVEGLTGVTAWTPYTVTGVTYGTKAVTIGSQKSEWFRINDLVTLSIVLNNVSWPASPTSPLWQINLPMREHATNTMAMGRAQYVSNFAATDIINYIPRVSILPGAGAGAVMQFIRDNSSDPALNQQTPLANRFKVMVQYRTNGALV